MDYLSNKLQQLSVVPISHSTVIRICKRNEKTGSHDKLNRCGRPKTVDVRGERCVCCLAKQHTFSYLKTITNELTSTHLNGNLSKWTVKHVFKKYGIRSHARRRKPCASFYSRKSRIWWANAVQELKVPEWNDVVFSNECRFGLKNDCKRLRVWRTKQDVNDTTLFEQTFQGATSVMFWGCTGSNGVDKLVVCGRTINSEKYIYLLHVNIFANVELMFGTAHRPFIFQQDNAPPHRAAYTKSHLSLRGVPVLPWPAQSPDMSIIENI